MNPTAGRRRFERSPDGGSTRLERTIRQLVAAMSLALCAVVPARAATTTEQSVSILIFPKVIFDGTRDTFIQISNTSNSMTHAHCFYVNAAPLCIGAGDCLAGTCDGVCQPQWVEVDFDIWLTKQQPTHWDVAQGRLSNPLTDVSCGPDVSDCNAAGLDPGRVPPVSSLPFTGELTCIEVDQSGAPISGNHLKGEATIVSSDGEASKYNAVGILGEPFTNDGNDVLCLGGGITDQCPAGAEYEGCGQTLILDHFAGGADDPLFGPTSEVDTELTVVPCAADFEGQSPASIRVNFVVFDEFELQFSASVGVTCWGTFRLSDIRNIFDVAVLESRFAQTQMVASTGSDSGFVALSEEFHHLDGEQTTAAFNLHEQGTRAATDLIIIPGGP